MTQRTCGNFSVYLDNSRAGDSRTAAYLFQDPVDLIVAAKSSEIHTAFDRIQQYLDDGYYVAGWISYETGLFLEGKLEKLGNASYGVPFLSLGVYKSRQILSSADSEDHWATVAGKGEYAIGKVDLNISRAEYEAAVSKIHDYLRAGDIYQVNFTLKSLFSFTGKPESYFAAMRNVQRVEYGAFIQSDDLSVLSLSPELFFQKTGRKIMARPMKGTCSRGRTVAEDQRNADFMNNDEKSRAENLMIVDLLRNDLSRISQPGSVKVKSLYDVEKYRTLFQMTSAIEAEVPDDVTNIDLIKALFPCGSVTGAPKIRAMEIISELEKDARGIYTGAIGFMAPDGDCCFSVPIRTVTIDKNGQGEMGIGSAIVADSDVGAEYDECLLKAQFATRIFQDFDLIESLRWSRSKDGTGGYHLLDLHMARLKSSADYFDFSCDEPAILSDLQAHADCLDPDKTWKVRLLLSRTGEISITSVPIATAGEGEIRIITLSDKMIDSQNPMLFHKTTDRQFYDQELSHHQQKYGSYDVVFVNEKGELTEGAYNNIFLKRGDVLYTPPLEAGVLGGTLRQFLMQDPSVYIEEMSLTPADLRRAEKIYMGNSVRGLVEVVFHQGASQDF